MLTPVCFNHKLGPERNEVHDVAADGCLSPEVMKRFYISSRSFTHSLTSCGVRRLRSARAFSFAKQSLNRFSSPSVVGRVARSAWWGQRTAVRENLAC
jgi:hypothetical protein